MGYRNNLSGLSSAPQWRASKGTASKVSKDPQEVIPEGETLEAYFSRSDEKDRFTSMYTKSFNQQGAARLRMGSLRPLQELQEQPPRSRGAPFPDGMDLEASIRPGSTGFASTVFDSDMLDLERPSSSTAHRWPGSGADARSPKAAPTLGHAQSDPSLRSPQHGPRARGGLLPLSRATSAGTNTAWGMAASALVNRRPDGKGEFAQWPDGPGDFGWQPDSQPGLRRPESQSAFRRPDSQSATLQRPGSQFGLRQPGGQSLMQRPGSQLGVRLPDGQSAPQRPGSQLGFRQPDGQSPLQRPDSQLGLRRPESQAGLRMPESQAAGRWLDSQVGVPRPGTQGGVPLPDSQAAGRWPDAFAPAREDNCATMRSSCEGGSSSSEAPVERQRSKAETRRNTVGLLSNPDLKRIAEAKFKSRDVQGTGRLEFQDYRAVLEELHAELGLDDPDQDMSERLFKRFEVDHRKTLDFNEFFEVLLGLLRQSAFDRSGVFGRDFFVQKHQGDVWDRYQKIRELGSGMFGTAYLVNQRQTREQQVVKAVRKSRVQIPVEDVEREILLLRQLDHPHVVRLRRWYEDAQHIYLVMDYLRGGSLKDKIKELQSQNHSLKERWVRTLIHQVLQGMSYCHGLRLIHKDLKDENIMLLKSRSPDPDKEPFAVIIDLGMAELFSPMDPQCRHVGGTPVTMAPQVWTGTFGPKCDVWSLGCVFYQLLVGRVPFYSKTMSPDAWIKEQKRGADWSLVRTSREGRDLCKAMLTFSEEDRPSMATCLQHRWFDLEKKELSVIMPADMEYLQEEYIRGSALKRALLMELASALPMDDADRIVDIFKEFDQDKDGQVSLQEVKQAFAKLGMGDERLAEKTFEALDLDQDGQLSFTEFSSWLLLGFEDLMEDRLYKMLSEYSENPNSKALDTDGVKRFLRTLESMLKKGAIGRSSSLLKELRSGGDSMIPYVELKKKILGPSGASSRPPSKLVAPPLAEAPPLLARPTTASRPEMPDGSGAGSALGGRPGLLPAALSQEEGQRRGLLLDARNSVGCTSPTGRGRARLGMGQSLQRLRTMYSSGRM